MTNGASTRENVGPEKLEKAAENVYLRLIARWAMATSLPVLGYALMVLTDLQKASIRQDERMISLSDRLDRQASSTMLVLTGRMDAQAARITQVDGELNRLRDYTYGNRRIPTPSIAVP